ncbi:hypothetical protein, partial [Rhizobium tibeticum]|uniref:hypothetical protein n=1 Tax=Rhizobium tibeticum TaxID=501024 RepID=UPI001AECDB86
LLNATYNLLITSNGPSRKQRAAQSGPFCFPNAEMQSKMQHETNCDPICSGTMQHRKAVTQP